MIDGFDSAQDFIRSPAAAAVRFYHQLDLALVGVGRRIAHHLVKVVVLFRLVYAERKHVLKGEEFRVVYLLADFVDRICERDVVARAQRAQVGFEAARGQALFQLFQIFGRGVCADELLVSGAAEQTGDAVTRRFDLLQRFIKAPFRLKQPMGQLTLASAVKLRAAVAVVMSVVC